VRTEKPDTRHEWQAWRLFYSQFRSQFLTTGAIAPSGAALARAMAAPLAAATPPRRVLEAGAGTGVFTGEILRHLERGDELDVYEINPVFIPWLERRREQAQAEARGIRCTIHNRDLRLAPAAGGYDFIISGLPLNNFSPALVAGILATFESCLRPSGVLSYFEYACIREIKRALVHDATERTRLDAVATVTRAFLARHPNQAEAVFWNLPPAIARHVTNTRQRGDDRNAGGHPLPGGDARPQPGPPEGGVGKNVVASPPGSEIGPGLTTPALSHTI
jgi:phosphatidylethanolamine/phosphatidyl-N-methylethanolamine N-methyltransferase